MPSEVMDMTSTIVALLVLGLAAASVAIRRVASRLLILTAILDVDRELFDELAQLFLSHEIATARRDSSADPPVEPDARSVDDLPEGLIECGIDVVDAEGRVIGTAVIPVPATN
jgi:hypothetical protein